jgi:hypothetical protein
MEQGQSLHTDGPAERHRHARPAWLRVGLIVTAVIVGAIVIVMLVISGDHGPGRHTGQAAVPIERLAVS